MRRAALALALLTASVRGWAEAVLGALLQRRSRSSSQA
jgi:hypothetical protein